MRRLFAIMAAGAAFVVVVPIGPAGAATTIACGDTITADVTLTSDLTCPSGVGLIVAGGVTVDFNGHTLDGAGSGLVGVGGGAEDAHLLNGTIRGFTAAGAFANGTYENMRIVANGSGIAAGNVPLSLIGSTVAHNTRDGVNAGNTRVRDTRVVQNGGSGISTTQGLHMSDSTVSGNGGHGIEQQALGLNLLDNIVSITGSVIHGNDLAIYTPYGDPITLSNDDFINSALDITTGYFGADGSIYVMNSQFINSPLTLGYGAVVDQGGNRGNSCPPELLCAP